MRYVVTAERPTYEHGRYRSPFRSGDVIEVPDGKTPDSDGDYFASRVSDGLAGHIAAGQLRPERASLSVDAVKAALAVKGVDDADAIVRLAQAIEGAL